VQIEIVARANHFIGGMEVVGEPDSRVQVLAPVHADGAFEYFNGDAFLVSRAVESSAEAFREWSVLGLKERSDLLRLSIERIRENAITIAAAESMETGRHLDESIAGLMGSLGQMEQDVNKALEVLAPKRVDSGVSVRTPYGPTALIVPWNYPLAIALRTLPALLMAGNTVVWKPSEKTPLSSWELARVIGLPSGVLNLVLGDRTVGSALVGDPRIKFVVHTGSSASGQMIAQESARHLRPTLLELGGKDVLIVDRDVDVQSTAEKVARASLENAGQICTSAERVLVHRDIHDQVTAALVDQVASWSLGRHHGEAREIGPLIDDSQLRIVEELVSDAVARGARVLQGGGRVRDLDGEYYAPTVIDGVRPDMRLFTEELFGPVVCVTEITSIEEGIQLANMSEYGLGATIISESPETLAQASRINAAIVWINEWHSPIPGAEFEPYGRSGLGIAGPGASTLRAVSRVMHVWDGGPVA
jgi:acyl-CoA reductase-like NAD-dependent aldehyde dehydrogenase